MKILITYATQNGSTRSIAERIQERIATAGIGNITLEPVDTKLSVNDFDAIIIGSCIHAGGWVRKGQRYIKNNEKVLRENPKPTWAFSVGMPPDGDKMKAEEKQMENWLLKHIALKGHKLFQGMFLEKDMSGCFKLFFSCFGGKYEDKRDWNAMDEWADEIVKELRIEQRNLGPFAHE